MPTPRLFLIVTLLCSPPLSIAQAATTPEGGRTIEIVHLRNVATDNEANSVLSAGRNMLDPQTKIYLIPETHDVVISGTPTQVADGAKLLNQLDQPKRSYRLTFTLAEFDNGRRVGVQHFATDVVVGQRIVLKQGNRVPTVTSTMNDPANTAQFTFVDVGVNLDFTLDPLGNGLRLRSKIEQSTASDTVTMGHSAQPTIRQTTLEGTTALTVGKATNIGGIDIFGSTRHLDVEVIAEPLA